MILLACADIDERTGINENLFTNSIEPGANVGG